MKKNLTLLILLTSILACFVSCIPDRTKIMKDVTFENPTEAPIKLRFKQEDGSYSSLYEIPAKSELKINTYLSDGGEYATIFIYGICYEECERKLHEGNGTDIILEPEYGFITIENKTDKAISDIKINGVKVSSYDINKYTKNSDTTIAPSAKKSFRVLADSSSKNLTYTTAGREENKTINYPDAGRESFTEITE